MDVQSKTSITEDIEHCLQIGALDQVALLLAHHEGKSKELHPQFQSAYRTALDQGKLDDKGNFQEEGNIQLFTNFYLARRAGDRVIPEKKLMLRAINRTISIYVNDFKETGPNKQLSPTIIKALYEMLAVGGMIKEFLDLYQDLKNITPKDKEPLKFFAQSEPDEKVWYASISCLEQQMKYSEGLPKEKIEELQNLRKMITFLTRL